MGLSIRGLMLSLIALNILAVIFMIQRSDHPSSSEFTKDRFESYFGQGGAPTTTILELDDISGNDLSGWDFNFFLRQFNPFRKFGAYPNVTDEYLNSLEAHKTFYHNKIYGLSRDPNYCLATDLYNIANPKNIFSKKNFFTDYDSTESILRERVIPEGGEDKMPEIFITMEKSEFDRSSRLLDNSINIIFTKMPFLHYFLKIGTQFICATQIYNHIPGHGNLKLQHLFLDRLEEYSNKFSQKPTCFDKNRFTLPKWRLYNLEECKHFFDLVSSSEFEHNSNKEHILFLQNRKAPTELYQNMTLVLKENVETLKLMYGNHGERCGELADPITMSKYLSHPLLLERGNKFKIRAFLLIASTTPTIAFYHDGYLLNSLRKYDKFSNDFEDHSFSTSYREAFENTTKYGMTEAEVISNIFSTYEQLQDFLKKEGKIKDDSWANSFLRPAIRRAMVHLVRMTEDTLWKQPNVFELYGVDFLMDERLDIYYDETFFSPHLSTPTLAYQMQITQMLIDMFEIEIQYYRSRMKRVLLIFKKMDEKSKENIPFTMEEYQDKYNNAMTNFLNSEYPISYSNSFIPLIDRNEAGSRAYFDLVDKKCID